MSVLKKGTSFVHVKLNFKQLETMSEIIDLISLNLEDSNT